MSGRAALRVTAGLNVGLHLLGLALALIGMRQGTPLVPLDERLAYLASRPIGWSLGWGTWMLCALALVAFLAVLATHAHGAPLASLAVTLAAAGAAIDLLCDGVQIAVLPGLASARLSDPSVFLAWERAAGVGGTVVANGLYSVAVLLAAIALRGRPGMPAHALSLGVATFGAGMLMVVAGFVGDPRRLELATGPTIGAFLLWTVAVARALLR